MYYSIGEVANATGIAISTLRYYDREGMFHIWSEATAVFVSFPIKRLIRLR